MSLKGKILLVLKKSKQRNLKRRHWKTPKKQRRKLLLFPVAAVPVHLKVTTHLTIQMSSLNESIGNHFKAIHSIGLKINQASKKYL
jgi:hypothetical protein